MKIGLYFGSFNPIHHGHLIIASSIMEQTDLEQVWFVVSPQNPLKASQGLLNEYHRLFLVNVAIEGDLRFRASDIEFKLPRPSFTVDTLTYLQEKYPATEFSIIMGSDSFMNLPKWKNFRYLLRHFTLFVYKRPGFELLPDYPDATVQIMDAPLIPISATHIRDMIKARKSIRYWVPEKVREEIENNRYYL